jgi:subtilisin family serine protease
MRFCYVTVSVLLVLLLVLASTPNVFGEGLGLPLIVSVDEPGSQAGNPVHADVRAALAENSTPRVIVNLRAPGGAGSSVEDRAAVVASIQDRVLGQLPAGSFRLIRRYHHVPALVGTVTAAALDRLARDPLVHSVQLDERVHGHDSGSLAALGADVLHDAYGITGLGVTVAVLDTGVDTDHGDFTGRIIAQQCFTDGDCQPGDVDQSTSADDLHGHGTNVTGVFGSSGVLDANTKGFAPAVDIVAVRVLDRNSSGWVSDWVAGLDWIYDNQATLNVDVINMSLGTYALYTGNCDLDFPGVASIVGQLVTSGVTIFASTGNQGSATSLASPSCNSGVVGVGATFDGNLGRQPSSGTWNSMWGGSWPACANETTSLDTITCFTNSNAQMDIVAPGCWITSSGMGGGTSTYAGTSQASPTAAGIAALMLERNPSLTPAQVETVLESTGKTVPDGKNGLQFPRIDALRAVLADTQVEIGGPHTVLTGTVATFTVTVDPFAATAPITYTWQATGQTPVVYTEPLSDAVSFTWTTPGTKLVSVEVDNRGGTFTDTHTVSVEGVVFPIYLPAVMR